MQVQARVRGRWLDSSLHSEAAGLLHSRQQFLVEFLVRLVGRDVDSVETGNREESLEQIGRFEAVELETFWDGSLPGVSLGQVVRVGVYQMDGEKPWSCRTCRTLHTYILVITALSRYTDKSPT